MKYLYETMDSKRHEKVLLMSKITLDEMMLFRPFDTKEIFLKWHKRVKIFISIHGSNEIFSGKCTGNWKQSLVLRKAALIYNPIHSILELYNYLAQAQFATSKVKLDILKIFKLVWRPCMKSLYVRHWGVHPFQSYGSDWNMMKQKILLEDKKGISTLSFSENLLPITNKNCNMQLLKGEKEYKQT